VKALVKARPEAGAVLHDLDPPTPGSGEVLIRVGAATICGTDVHIYQWDGWAQRRIKPPLIFGHEFSGEVVEVGHGVKTVKVGDHVSAETHLVCNQCYQCRTGNAHVCRNVKIIGIDVPGAFGEYAAIPAANAWVNDPGMPWELASIQEPFGNAVHTVFAGPGVAGRDALVTGCGPIGLMSIAVARAAGATKIFATDINRFRLDLARRMGADRVIDVSQEDPVEIVMQETGGKGVDALLEISGNAGAIHQGFAALREGGHASLLGLPAKPVEFDLSREIVMRGIVVYGIAGRRMWETWYQVSALLESGRVDLSPLFTHRFALAQYQDAFEAMIGGDTAKVALIP
jgi:threonine 3-dehydrogenase